MMNFETQRQSYFAYPKYDKAVANQLRDNNITPIIFAARLNREEIMDILIEKGADVTFVSEKNETAIKNCAMYKNIKYIKKMAELQVNLYPGIES